MADQPLSMPDDTHVFRMTDDTGMFQHAKYTVPDPSYGYTSDDNARALIMAAMLYETSGSRKYLDLAHIYMHFLLYARKGEGFRNFMDYDRNFHEEKGSDDCFGRCIWSLGYVSACSVLSQGLRETADYLLREMTGGCRNLRFIRSKAYAVLGLCHWGNGEKNMLRKLASDIARAFERNADGGWRWFEDKITYCNASLPLSMLEAYSAVSERRWLDTGLESLDFLLNTTFREGVFHPIGCNGWLEKGKEAAGYDQQPVEACETLLACVKAYGITKDKKYMEYAKGCLDWYTGKNTAGISLIDPDTGGCMDGITPSGPNKNQGAESLVSWLIAWLVWNKAKNCYKRRDGNVSV